MNHPGVDLTGIEGAFDFVLNFSNPLQAMTPAGADPNGALTLAEAIDKELGLKLELQKHPMPVLVIDHVEEKASGNNHILQSTVFAVIAGLLTLFLRNNHARTRYWIWLTASLKFLISVFAFR